MTRGFRIIATPLTGSSPTPGKEQPGGTTWRWRNKPPAWPYDPATHDKSPRDAVRDTVISRRQNERNARIRRYIQARCGGMDEKQAAAAVDVSANNAGRDYESIYADIPPGKKTAGHVWQPAPGDPDAQDPDGMACYRCGITEAEAAQDGAA